MSKPFDYSKWDNIELSDDEDDVHPNIDKESWFRMKHRSRVEREENESKDKQRIQQEMAKAEKRIATLQHDLAKLEKAKASKKKDENDEDSDDDDLDDREALQAELHQLQQQNATRQSNLDEYEKNKKWNVDNMFEVKEERTFVSPTAGTTTYTSTGYVKPKEELEAETKAGGEAKKHAAETKHVNTAKIQQSASAKSSTKSSPSAPAAAGTSTATSNQPSKTTKPTVTPAPVEIGAMETYHEFTERHADTVEMFMKIPDLSGSKAFLLRYGDVILQENASNYLLLASLEDEMNGYHEKMKRTARQSQIVTNIAELAKTLKTHPGNVIEPFFARLEQREHLEEFVKGVKVFQEKIIKRAVTKRQEMDAAREEEAKTNLSDIPLEQRLGPGGLDPLEVIETLPKEMVAAFESRSMDDLREALEKLSPEDAEYHMKRCVDSGLWVANAQN